MDLGSKQEGSFLISGKRFDLRFVYSILFYYFCHSKPLINKLFVHEIIKIKD